MNSTESKSNYKPHERKKCENLDCKHDALFLENRCWWHLLPEEQAKYKGKLVKWIKTGKHLIKANFRWANLKGINLSGLMMRVADFSNANLENADLSKSKLGGAKFRSTTLYGANFQEAELNNSDFEHSFCDGANFRKANFKGAKLNYASLDEADFQESNLSFTELKMATLSEAKLQNSDFTYAKMEEAYMPESNLNGADFYGSNLSKAHIVEANLRNVNLSNASLEATNLSRSDLEGSRLMEANLRYADLSWASLKSAFLEFADLSSANLHEANLDGAFLHQIGLDNTRNLTWEQIREVGEERIHKWENAISTYRTLKKYFSRQDLPRDRSLAYYREKLMDYKHSWSKGNILKGFGLLIFRGLAGFGEHLWKTIVAAVITIIAFGFAYWIGATIFHLHFADWIKPTWFHYFYFSVVTFATLGFGDISPMCPQAYGLVMAEVLQGYIFLGLIVTFISRKMSR